MGTQEKKAGRELDAAIAEKVMGHPTFAPQVIDKIGAHVWNNGVCRICGMNAIASGIGPKECLPHYSTDIAAALTVIDEIQRKGYPWSEFKDLFTDFPDFEKLPWRICLAALKAVGHE